MFIFTILTAILAIAFAAIGFYRTSDRFAVGKRIEQIKIADAQTAEEELSKPFIQRVLLPLGDYVAKLFRGYTPDRGGRTHAKEACKAGLFPRVTGGAIGRLVLVQCRGLCDPDVPDDSGAGYDQEVDFKYTDPWNIAYYCSARSADTSCRSSCSAGKCGPGRSRS